MNKGLRNELRQLKYKKRIMRFANNSDVYITRTGKRIYAPKTIDVLNDNGQQCYKDTSTPCSCYMCSPDKYNRAKTNRKLKYQLL